MHKAHRIQSLWRDTGVPVFGNKIIGIKHPKNLQSTLESHAGKRRKMMKPWCLQRKNSYPSNRFQSVLKAHQSTKDWSWDNDDGQDHTLTWLAWFYTVLAFYLNLYFMAGCQRWPWREHLQTTFLFLPMCPYWTDTFFLLFTVTCVIAWLVRLVEDASLRGMSKPKLLDSNSFGNKGVFFLSKGITWQLSYCCPEGDVPAPAGWCGNNLGPRGFIWWTTQPPCGIHFKCICFEVHFSWVQLAFAGKSHASSTVIENVLCSPSSLLFSSVHL